MSIGRKLKEVRTFRNITQKRLSELTGISTRLIQKYEADERSPKDDNLEKLANALQVSPKALSNTDISTYDDIMFSLFELEKLHGTISISNAGGKPQLSFDSMTLNNYIEAWQEAKETLSPEELEEWKLTFPDKITKRLRKGKFVPIDES